MRWSSDGAHWHFSNLARCYAAGPYTGRVPPQFLTHFLPGLILDLASVPIPIGGCDKFVEWVGPGFVQPDLRTELGPWSPNMGLGHFERIARLRCMAHPLILPLSICVLRLSNFPFRRELAGTVGHRLNSAFSFGQVFATAPDTDVTCAAYAGTKA